MSLIMKKFKILLPFIFVILIFIFSNEKFKKQNRNIVLGLSILSREYSIALLKSLEELGINEVKLGQTLKLYQVGSFVDENSSCYLTLEDYKVGKNLESPIGKLTTKDDNKVVYIKFKVFRAEKESKDWLIVDITKYRIAGRACNSIKKVCYEFQDRQEPKIDSKKEINTRTYYLISAIPESENIDVVVFTHLSFGRDIAPLGSSETNDLPLVKFIP